MSHFYGGVHGARGPATRCGTKRSGLTAYAKTWLTRIEVTYKHHDGVDHARIEASDEEGNTRSVLWQGSEDELLLHLADSPRT